MVQSIVKGAVLWAISKGLRLPQPPIDRVSELSFLVRLLKEQRIDCVLDVGANRGQFASELRAIGYGGHIVSFEPVGTEFAAMKERMARDPRWTGHQLALGRRTESLTISIPRLTVMSSLLEPIY